MTIISGLINCQHPWYKELTETCLLNVVDLVMLPLLVACDLPLRLLHQVAHPADLRALPHGVLHRLGQSQSGLPDPLVQPSVDCRTNTPDQTQHGVCGTGGD